MQLLEFVRLVLPSTGRWVEGSKLTWMYFDVVVADVVVLEIKSCFLRFSSVPRTVVIFQSPAKIPTL